MLWREVMQEAQPSGMWQGMITLTLFLLAFAYLGWRRGYRRELVTLLAIFIGHRLWTTALGDKLVNRVNEFYLMGRIGIEARFDPLKMMELAQKMDQMQKLITDERKEPFLFFTFLFMVLLGYALGHAKCCLGNLLRRFLESPRSLIGALFGAVNGYLLILWLFPTLFAVLPGAPPGRPVAARAAEGMTTRDVLAKGVSELAGILGLEPAQLLLIVVGTLVLWVAWKSR